MKKVIATFARTIRASRQRPELLLFVLGVCLISIHLLMAPQRAKQLLPIEVKQFNVAMLFEGGGQDVRVSTYVPQNSRRQTVLEQTAKSGLLDYHIEQTEGGLLAIWEGEELNDRVKISYTANIIQQKIEFIIDSDITLSQKPTQSMNEYLQATNNIQVDHPEITLQWQRIKPQHASNLADVLLSIFNYTRDELTTVPFKGTTDALTALRLGQASCNGKSRLFVALARLNHIPARLVGGVILDNGQKKTSHQWVEVRIGEHWVPMDPTNGHYAALPANYLELYRGDFNLFAHTASINFDYSFTVRTKKIAAGAQTAIVSPNSADRFNTVALLAALGLDEQTASIFLLFPFCALLISFFRNVVGINSFGIFMPMLIAAACRYTGLSIGLFAFFAILTVAFLMHGALEKSRLLKIPRLAAVVTVVTLVFLVVISMLDVARSPLELGIIALFPVVIISFTAERLHHMMTDGNWKSVVSHSVGTLFLIVVCYFIFSSLLLRGSFTLYPELYLLVLSAQIYIGRWMGVRVTEFWRFHRLIRNAHGRVLGINARNRELVLGQNRKALINVANDKLQTKAMLEKLNVPVIPTLAYYESVFQSQNLIADLQQWTSFVIKPNHGSKGRGILIVTADEAGNYRSVDGIPQTIGDIHQQVQQIFQGSFSAEYGGDQVIVEPKLLQVDIFNRVAPFGLSDIRVLLDDGKPVAAMWRVPTRASQGKANLYQGAVGVAIDMTTGKTYRAQVDGKAIQQHPDSLQSLIGIKIPDWSKLLEISQQCFTAIPLGFLGVDICLDLLRGPVVIEVNARPGLEIQNVRDRGISDLFSRLQEGMS